MIPSLGLDHLYLRVHDLDAVLALFHERLGLPLSWPLREEPFARYAWVNAGNVQIELWQARSNDDLPAATPMPCIAGAALWPDDVHASRRALESAGVRCKEPRPWRTPAAGGEALNFTNCLVSDASGPACQVFFCQWDPEAPIVPWPRGEGTAQRRARQRQALAQSDGIVALRALHLQTPDAAASARAWQAITGSPGVAAPGVALVLEPGPVLRFDALVFEVGDLASAAHAMALQGIHSEHSGGVLWLAQEQAFGLRLGLAAGATLHPRPGSRPAVCN